jgi:hypothetical protein
VEDLHTAGPAVRAVRHIALENNWQLFVTVTKVLCRDNFRIMLAISNENRNIGAMQSAYHSSSPYRHTQSNQFANAMSLCPC